MNLLACINKLKSSYCVLQLSYFSEIWDIPFTTKQICVFSTKQLFKPQGGERGGRALRNSEDGIEITYLFSFMDLVECRC